jgi:hypothetical protein
VTGCSFARRRIPATTTTATPTVREDVADADRLPDRRTQRDHVAEEQELVVVAGEVMLDVAVGVVRQLSDRVLLPGGRERLARDGHPAVETDHQEVQ